MNAVLAHVKRYSVPLVLFALGLFFQLVVLPSSYPSSHYDVLLVRRFAPVEEIEEAYSKLSSKWFLNLDVPTVPEFLKIRYAFELLTNPLWKRDYDLFAIDEQQPVINEAIRQYAGQDYSKVNLPLLDGTPPDSMDQDLNILTSEEFKSIVGGSKAVLIQVFSFGSHYCARFINSWKRIAALLDGVANTGLVELKNVQLATFFAERNALNQPIFRKGLPALIAFPPYCANSDCYTRYSGDFSVDAIVDWLATTVLDLPRIPYYSKESLVQKFFSASGSHKVKVIFFSKTGERAFPFLRQAVKDYSSYASFAAALWQQEESSIWWSMFQVDSAPAIVFVKDPSVTPVVHHGSLNSSLFFELMEKNKNQELPQLRSANSMELGCDARGFSRAGNFAETWYCAIVAGRPGLALNKMRETMRGIQRILRDDFGANGDKASVKAPAAATAVKEKRLTFAWLDGGAQKVFCLFYLHKLENIYETCGPSEYDSNNRPRLFVVRYKRNSSEDEARAKRKPNNIWSAFDGEDSNLASQIVAIYNGSIDTQEVIQWLSWIVEDGDKSTTHPYFIGAAPSLVPEDSTSFVSKSARSMFSASNGIKNSIHHIAIVIHGYSRDPRIGPVLLLCACISFGAIWIQSNTVPAQLTEVDCDGKSAPRNPSNRRRKGGSSRNVTPSITDAEPKDANQLLSDSNSD
ncbi:uncharacterized protein LOC110028911 [Phalaenopsis equestris]|uniref:uncharacterized protein LOC110028911 n=1 Tax=Phalaenopsis equestris TaxID=78828 RepID=UPI0009E1CE47|nr:uncharacterized protein LOC110028911 [Phalaenopsis equestris]